jgi:Arabinose efflux permease
VGWSVSLYEIGSIVAGAASALLTMRFGLRAPMGMAAVLFGFGCILSAVSPTMPLLLTGRALQGLGGGGLVAMGFVAVGLIFPRRYIARAMAAVSTLWGVSAFAGPLVGGFFVEYATWRWGFAFFACQAFALALWIVLRSDAGATRSTADGCRIPCRASVPVVSCRRSGRLRRRRGFDPANGAFRCRRSGLPDRVPLAG